MTTPLRSAVLSAAIVLVAITPALSACGAPPSFGQAPTADADEQQPLCDRLESTLLSGKPVAGRLRPSSALVPAPLTFTGFGVPDAHCAVNPDLGVYYEMLVWHRRVSSSAIQDFEAQLEKSGFTRDDQSQSQSRSYDSPPGIEAEIDHRLSRLQNVVVFSEAGRDPITSVVWI